MALTIWQWARLSGGLSAPATQLVRPTSTISAGSWTAIGAASLHAATSDQSTGYAVSSLGSGSDVLVLGLDAMSTPDVGDVTITVRHRAE